MNKTELGYVKTDIKNGIATIEFFHPSHNSLPGRLLKLLVKNINAAGENDDIKVVILKSSGDRTFCAGASFDELSSIDNLETGKEFFMGFANVINAIRVCPKFVIGRVQGKAVGGGVGLASAVDYCVATKFASVKLSELAIGIGPFVIGPAVERKIGLSAFSQSGINATDWYAPNWAREKGLFMEIFDSADLMDENLEKFAQKLAGFSPDAMREYKRVLWQGTENWDKLLAERAAISGRLVLSDFTKNAIAKFQRK